VYLKYQGGNIIAQGDWFAPPLPRGQHFEENFLFVAQFLEIIPPSQKIKTVPPPAIVMLLIMNLP
jgi:hypothetical protein